MIVDINKVYVLSVPQATEGMEDFIESTSSDCTYVKMRKIYVGEATVRSIAKPFEHNGQWLQAVIYVTDLPVKTAKQHLVNKINQVKSYKAGK